METISPLYLAPLMLANGATNYILSKCQEKKIIANFNDIKTGYVTSINKHFVIPNEIKDMVQLLEKSIPNENLYNLYNNLKTVQIEKQLSLLLLGIKGKYDSKNNILSYSLISSLEHELIHLASSYYDKGKQFWQSGFLNYSNNLVFAKAFNEGYTDLTARRIFNKKTKFYDEEVKIVEKIEQLFDKERLQKYYFNNDTVALINTLCKYMKREEVIKLFVTFDLGFDLKKQGNLIYKVIYASLESKLSDLYKQYCEKPKQFVKQNVNR